MFCKITPRGKKRRETDRFVWYPNGERGESQQERDKRVTRQWWMENVGEEMWEDYESLLNDFALPSRGEFLGKLCGWDAAPLVELLYPRDEGLFLKGQPYTIDRTWFQERLEKWFGLSGDNIMHWRLNAACLFAFSGASSCLETLLEQGADPNGLDCPEGLSGLVLWTGQLVPVTPLDCAMLARREDCQMVLELFGGESCSDLLPK